MNLSNQRLILKNLNANNQWFEIIKYFNENKIEERNIELASTLNWKAYFRLGKLIEADNLLEKLIKNYPNNKQVIINYGNYQFRKGNYGKAFSYYEKVVKNYPSYKHSPKNLYKIFNEIENVDLKNKIIIIFFEIYKSFKEEDKNEEYRKIFPIFLLKIVNFEQKKIIKNVLFKDENSNSFLRLKILNNFFRYKFIGNKISLLNPISRFYLQNDNKLRNFNKSNFSFKNKKNKKNRILIVSGGESFLKYPCEILEKNGYELTFLSQDVLRDSLNIDYDRNLPNFDSMLYGIGPYFVTKEEVNKSLIIKAPFILDLIREADIVYVEWCTTAAIWFSKYLPQNIPLVVRLHRFEAFREFPKFLNSNGINKLIFIAPHVRKAFYKFFPEHINLKNRDMVIQNIRKINKSKLLIRSSQGKKTLCMVGYAKHIKDPIFALNILKILLETTSEKWELKLIGKHWPTILSSEDQECKKKFDRDLSNLNNFVEFIPFCDDPKTFTKRFGFVISSSIVEGSHESVVEAMSVGCIPILRNWPMFKKFNAAKKMFNEFPVHDTPQECATQIKKYLENFDFNSKRSRDFSFQKFYNKEDQDKFMNALTNFN